MTSLLKLVKSPEQALLDWFSETFNGSCREDLYRFKDKNHWCVSFTESTGDDFISGHGFDSDRAIAIVKAIAELIERRVYLRDLESNPICKSTSGYAVHFSLDRARESAKRELIERHLLYYSFLKDGWQGFQKIESGFCDNTEYIKLVTNYSLNGLRAGLVILKPHDFNGVTFGYFVETSSKIHSSSRWDHATAEALSYLERMREVHDLEVFDDPLAREMKRWLYEEWNEPTFSPRKSEVALPFVDIKVAHGVALMNRSLITPLYYAKAKSDKLIPFFVNKSLKSSQREKLDLLLSSLGLELNPNVRLPVL